MVPSPLKMKVPTVNLIPLQKGEKVNLINKEDSFPRYHRNKFLVQLQQDPCLLKAVLVNTFRN
jgi:hypothetical protein